MPEREPHGRHQEDPEPPGARQSLANPLRHGADRFQAWTGRLLIVLAALLVPLAAFAVGSTVYHGAHHTSEVQAGTRHRVTATTTATAETNPIAARVPVSVLITDPGHPDRRAVAHVTPGTPTHTRLHVYVDNHSGQIVPAPLSAAVGVQRAAWAAAGTALACGLLTAGSLHVLGTVTDRWRLARWEHEWRLVEPVWWAQYTHPRGKGRP